MDEIWRAGSMEHIQYIGLIRFDLCGKFQQYSSKSKIVVHVATSLNSIGSEMYPKARFKQLVRINIPSASLKCYKY